MWNEYFFSKLPDDMRTCPICFHPLSFLLQQPTPKGLQIEKKGDMHVYSVHLRGEFGWSDFKRDNWGYDKLFKCNTLILNLMKTNH